ncbi:MULTISPECIES: class I SAM-dependent methyltransferase [Micromonospora]|uniref:Class I SAM-dependent methyltransferase n=1 Tax=Micromonospora aurantiaca (nom. illeg.) TaxID=47850 RepID=A0A3M9KAY9_9ACTN|nr:MULTISPECIES: class I SAM-dependent methyltransferase [Micromonospora]ADL47536.1 C-methyltransferase [Micromonospora aurantiaca ATCC 27029]ADU09885.1 C-methyltransferase [Micromonospora sp. L5]AXH93415.1 class I SAM-dependent methyltransferase [Micromonospora aurantiaca]KAB1116488.1 class I SAM-dependent methyltransferase [Micromonospora aurantiaca]MBC9000401.1 class I SAM-dependent methyltransferase [Micromonospora aurantiaca]
MLSCRTCGGELREFCDFGPQPLSSGFLEPDYVGDEFFFRLAVGVCGQCSMVQLIEEVPRHLMFNGHYPYLSSGSATMRKHFEQTAKHFIDTELTGDDAFLVELGCNDGVMLKVIADAGIRHLGVEPSQSVAAVARAYGVQVTTEFFQESSAQQIRAASGPAQVIYAANTICHIPYLDSIFRGVDELLAPDGIFVFEDPYLAEIVDRTSFDQIYDEHFYFFSAVSVQAMAARFGFELVDVERLPVHGGEVRYTIARRGARPASARVAALVAEEHGRDLAGQGTLKQFVGRVEQAREELTTLLRQLKANGQTVVGYGATAKSATVTNYCGIGPDLISFISDTTPNKQGRLTPGSHIPVRSRDAFAAPYPDYALLFAWNHADEIIAKEQEFRKAGGKWILYVPEVRVV